MRIRTLDFALATLAIVGGFVVIKPVLAANTPSSKDSCCIASPGVKVGDTKENMMSLARAIVMYSQDNADLLPFAFGPSKTPNAPEMWRWTTRVRVPQGWDDSPVGRSSKDSDAQVWVNSVRPYYKSNQILSAPGLPEITAANVFGNPIEEPARVGFTYNGLLHTYNVNAVVEPSKVPLVWQGLGLVNAVGWVMSNPTLSCFPQGNTPCKYGMPNLHGSHFAMLSETVEPNSKFLFVSPDLTLTEKTLNQQPAPANPTDQMYTFKDNRPVSMWLCLNDQGRGYPCDFMPDRTNSK